MKPPYEKPRRLLRRVLLLSVASAFISLGLGWSLPAEATATLHAPPAPPSPPSPQWLDERGEPLPFADSTAAEEFLRTAEIVSSKLLGKGSTGVLRVDLRQGSVEARAVFRAVEEEFHRRSQGTRPDPHAKKDSHRFEVAAYRLDRLLGLGRVPPTVRRTINGQEGSLQLWIENAQTAAERHELGLPAPPYSYHQQQIMRAFDVVVGNWDRHLNNELYDSSGFLWFIDHTRTFLRTVDVTALEGLHTVEADFYRALTNTTEEQVREILRDVLDKLEISALNRRVRKLREHFDGLIEARGEDYVLYDLGEVTVTPTVVDSWDSIEVSIQWPETHRARVVA